MEKGFDLYQDIAERTDGDVYVGVVGPCRTGKSTFIARFMEELVLPNMQPGPRRDRVQDELPQSASGRGIMTTQPKFVPGEAAEISLGEGAAVRVRMVDSVDIWCGALRARLKAARSAWCIRPGRRKQCPSSRRRKQAPAR